MPDDAPKRHVFISYVRNNRRKVDRLAKALEDYGITVWLDRKSLRAGDWKIQIRRAIQTGAHFIACFSAQYEARSKSYMHEELTFAMEELRQRPEDTEWFIPVTLDGTSIPDRSIGGGRTLRDLQCCDLSRDRHDGVRWIIEQVDPEGAVPAHSLTILANADADVLRRLAAARDLAASSKNASPPRRRSAVHALLLHSRERDLTPQIYSAFPVVGESAIPDLLTFVETDDAVRQPAVDALAAMGEPVADHLSHVMRLADDPRAQVRFAALECIGNLGASAALAVPLLVSKLADESGEFYEQPEHALRALALIGSPAAESIPQLIGLLRDSMRSLQDLAADALGAMGKEAAAAVPHLVEMLAHPARRTRMHVADALEHIGSEAYPALGRLYALAGRSDDDELGHAEMAIGGIILGILESPTTDSVGAVLDIMVQSINDEMAEASWAAGLHEVLNSMSWNDDVSALGEAFGQFLSHPDRAFRHHAARAIQNLGVPSSAEPYLLASLDEEVEEVLDEKIEALNRIDSPDAIAAIREYRPEWIAEGPHRPYSQP